MSGAIQSVLFKNHIFVSASKPHNVLKRPLHNVMKCLIDIFKNLWKYFKIKTILYYKIYITYDLIERRNIVCMTDHSDCINFMHTTLNKLF